MPWKVDLRSHDGALSERLITTSMTDAEAWFRRLLALDLTGHPVAARIVSPVTRRTIYFSRFDLERNRIHPQAPLNLLREDDGTLEAAEWRPVLPPQEEFDQAWAAALAAKEAAEASPEDKAKRGVSIRASWAFHQAADRLRREGDDRGRG